MVEVTGVRHPPLVRLPGTTWSLWPVAAVRSSGFPASLPARLCDTAVADAADRAQDPEDPAYRVVWSEAMSRVSTATSALATEPAFRAAVTWQNPALLRLCLDPLTRPVARRTSKVRQRQRAVASYAQRYAWKNDTIGFFGPLTWATVDSDSEPDAGTAPGTDGVIAPRTPSDLHHLCRFETWGVRALSAALSSRPGLWPALVPRRASWTRVRGSVLCRPMRTDVHLTSAEADLLERCDGTESVRSLVGSPPRPEASAALLRLRELEAIVLEVPARGVFRTDDELLEAFRPAPEPAADETPDLGDLIALRDELEATATDSDRLHEVLVRLGATFTGLTGLGSTREPGSAYAGRTLVHLDSTGNSAIRIGGAALGVLARPLSIVLDSAGWLSNRAADLLLLECERLLDAAGGDEVDLGSLLWQLFPEFSTGVVPRHHTVDRAVDELRTRWQRGLGPIDATTREVRRLSSDLPPDLFPVGRPRFAGAGWHSPDLMLANACDPGAPPSFVLGELHPARNALEANVFSSRIPWPELVRAAVEASPARTRVLVSSRRSLRLAPNPSFSRPEHRHLSFGPEIPGPADGVHVEAVAGLVVRRTTAVDGTRHLHALDPCGTFTAPLVEVLGDALSTMLLNAFVILPPAPHHPRVVLDDLVVLRETWTRPAEELRWAWASSEAGCFLEARRWRRALDLPRRCFVRLSTERKPLAVDFDSPPLVTLVAHAVRAAVRAQPSAVAEITEMLPDLDDLWLRDTSGTRYTSELRLVAVPDPITQERAVR